jgi:hypothetical protein
LTKVAAKAGRGEPAAVEGNNQRHTGTFKLLDDHLLEAVLDVWAGMLESHVPVPGFSGGNVGMPKAPREPHQSAVGKRHDYRDLTWHETSGGTTKERDLIRSQAFDCTRTKGAAVLQNHRTGQGLPANCAGRVGRHCHHVFSVPGNATQGMTRIGSFFGPWRNLSVGNAPWDIGPATSTGGSMHAVAISGSDFAAGQDHQGLP